jgi:cell division protein FtsQ
VSPQGAAGRKPSATGGRPSATGRRPSEESPPIRRAPRALSGPRISPARSEDLASRSRLISNQRHRARLAGRYIRALARGFVHCLVLTALAVAAYVAWDWMRRTPFLAMRTVEVVGAHRLDEASVRRAAAIEPGTNLLAVDVVAAEARVASLPAVRRAHVVRHLPGRVTVLVEEREPYALVNAGGLHWVDAEGYLVTGDARPGATGLPILTGVGAPVPGTAQPSEGLRAGLALLHVLQRTAGRLAARVSELDLARPHAPVLYLVDGIEVRLGSDAWSDRLARLDAVLGELDARGERMATIDLRFRDQVVLTPRIPAQVASPARAMPAAGRRSVGDSATLVTPAAAGLERR